MEVWWELSAGACTPADSEGLALVTIRLADERPSCSLASTWYSRSSPALELAVAAPPSFDHDDRAVPHGAVGGAAGAFPMRLVTREQKGQAMDGSPLRSASLCSSSAASSSLR